MAPKRKRDEVSTRNVASGSVVKPAPGTQSFKTGNAVKQALAEGSFQAFTSLSQQILVERSQLPLAITHPAVVILQHYVEVSPECEEIFNAWRDADRAKNMPLVEKCVSTLSQILRILSGVPFFRTTAVGLVNKLVGNTEPYSELLCRLITSDRRESSSAGLALAGAAIAVDPPNPASSGYGSSGRLAGKVWSVLSDGGCLRVLPKLLTMRRRDKEGNAIYREADPLDKPDLRHLCLEIVLPMLSTPGFGSHARQILRSIYNNLDVDPPTTILRILTAIYNATCLPSPGLARKISLTLLDENALEQIIRLLDRDIIEPSTGRSVGDITMSFLEAVTTNPERGLCFQDEGWYPRRRNDKRPGGDDDDENEPVRGNREDRIRRGLHNRILSNVVRNLGSKVVSDKGRVGEWAIKVFQACPELVASYWPHCSLLVEPRLESSWFSMMSYIGRIISLPVPPTSSFRLPPPRGTEAASMPFRPSPPPLENIIESIFPSPLTPVHLTKGLLHTDPLLQYMTAVTLARAMQKLDAVQTAWKAIEEGINEAPSSSTAEESPWVSRRREIEYECRRRAPEPMVIIAFAQKSATMSPVEPETAEEKAMAAKSAMLTEVALRLFGLYYRTMPSLTYEIKFDVGRLLVSSSSNKAERRERQAAKAAAGSSVVGGSEVGSVRSVGTAGTAGMGGGFGYARGDVEGFEALSQVHVVKLLRDVRDWQWTNKAAGSQYTYLYHILQLHLSTSQPTSSKLTTSLLRSLLAPTLLFDADPDELDIYLDALPRLDGSPWGIIQGVYLLSFLDDAVKRALQRPYKYIEDAEAVIPDCVPWDRQEDLPSPLLMVIVEQVVAKIVGSHIGSDAGVVILQYLRRVLLGILGKTPDGRWVGKVAERLEGMLEAIKEKGGDKPGVKEAVRRIRADVTLATGEEMQGSAGEEIKELTDEEQWRESSFERICLDSTAQDWENETPDKLQGIFNSSSPRSVVRHARFVLLLLASSRGSFSTSSVKKAGLRIVKVALNALGTDWASARLKRALPESPWLKASWTGDAGDSYREELNSLVGGLDPAVAEDAAVADIILSPLVERFGEDKKNKSLSPNLTLLSPWTPFVEPAQATTILPHILGNAKRFATLSENDKGVICRLVERTQDIVFVGPHLPTLLDLDVISPISNLLVGSSTSPTGLDIGANAIEQLVSKSTDEAYDLLKALVESSPSSIRPALELIRHRGVASMDLRMLPALNSLCDLQVDFEGINESALFTSALKALVSPSTSQIVVDAALSLIQRFASHTSLSALQHVITTSTPFSLPLAKLLSVLAACEAPEQGEAASYLVNMALWHLVSILSGDQTVLPAEMEMVSTITASLRNHPALEVDLLLAEPVITATIQERLSIPAAVELAAVLGSRVELKASFVRQHLQLLFSHPIFPSLTPTSSDPTSQTLRAPIIRLLCALFHASPYASCQPNLVEPILALYGGKMTAPDQALLRVFQLFEAQRKVSIGSLLKHWNANGKAATAGGGKVLDALLSLDAGLVLKTCGNFPLRRSFSPISISSPAEDRAREKEEEGMDKMKEGVYDPLFVLLLLSGAVVEGGIRHLDWVEILRSNVLGLAICALASRDSGMRRLAGWVLSKAYAGISASNFQERDQLVYVLRLLRHTLPSPLDSSGKVARLPTITALFLAHALASLANPGSFLYPLTSHFLLQRSTFDPYDVPMLFSLLYSSSDDHKRERGFIVRLIRDGVRSEADWRALKKRRTWSLLATIFFSNPDVALRRLILQAMVNMSKIPAAARSLTYKNGLISWCFAMFDTINFNRPRNASEEQGRLVEIVENAIIAAKERVVISRGPKGKGKKKNVPDGEQDGDGMDVDGEDPEKTGAQEQQPELSSKDKGWIAQAMTFVNLAARTADLDRLEVLARLAYRFCSVVPYTTAAGDLLPPLTNRFSHLSSSSSASPADEDQKGRIVDMLFRISLCLQPKDLKLKTVQSALPQIREWLDEANKEGDGGDVGGWYARERRRAEWEDWQVAQENAILVEVPVEEVVPSKEGKKNKEKKSRATKGVEGIKANGTVVEATKDKEKKEKKSKSKKKASA